MTMTTPDYMPILSEGAHHDPSQGVCAMEAAAFLAGEPHSDEPACVHPVIASMARAVNDRLPGDRRGELWPLIIRSMGTADTRKDATEREALSARLAAWCARQVLHLTADQDAALAAIEAAEAWADCPCSDHAAKTAHAAKAASAASAAADAHAYAHAAKTAHADAAVRVAANAGVAAKAASAVHAADAAADATKAAHANADVDLVALLAGLIDYHAELTGHTPVSVTDDEIQVLAEAVGA